MRKILLGILILFLAINAPALEINPAVSSVTLYSSSALVTKTASVSTDVGEVAVRIIIPQQADEDTIIITDNGATITQFTIETEEEDRESIMLKMINANAGKAVFLGTENFNINGTIEDTLRDVYVTLSDVQIIGDGIAISTGQKLLVPINSIETMSFEEEAEIVDIEETLVEYINLLENATVGDRQITTSYFVSGSSWKPIYNFFIENDRRGTLQYWSKATNNTTEDWNGIDLTIVAGQPNMKYSSYYRYYAMEAVEVGAPAPAVEGEQYGVSEAGEMHVYDLKRNVSIVKNSSAYIPILSETLNYEEMYIWNAYRESKVKKYIKFLNTTENPLAPGWISVYKNGTYLGGNNLQWIQKDVNAEVYISTAPDIKIERTVEQTTSEQPSLAIEYYSVKLHLENKKSKAVKITVKDYLPSDAEDFRPSIPITKKEGNTIEWEVEIAAGAVMDITYTYNTKRYRRY